MHNYYVIQVGEVISPRISTEGAEGQLDQFVLQVDLQPPQAHSDVELYLSSDTAITESALCAKIK